MSVLRYPFTAIVGQEQVKKAMLLALINPRTGGLLISGKRGTAKSVLVRAAAPFTKTGKLVELPLGAADDMVFGSFSVDTALQDGVRFLRHGIIQRAAHTLLYIDEVNLLREEILRAVLQSAAAGMFFLERDGISAVEEVSCTPIGTMDPQEGVLSPVLLDSFGMFAATEDVTKTTQRTEIIRRVLYFERTPKLMCSEYKKAETKLHQQVEDARKMLFLVEASSAILQLVAQYVKRALCVGNRAEIYLVEASRALAALAGRTYVLPQDVEEAAIFVLAHRMSRQKEQYKKEDEGKKSADDSAKERQEIKEALAAESKAADAAQQDTDAKSHEMRTQGRDFAAEGKQKAKKEAAPQESKSEPSAESASDTEESTEVVSAMETVMARLSLLYDAAHGKRGKSGRRKLLQFDLPTGRSWRTAMLRAGQRLDLAFAATLRAAAPYQKQRCGEQAVVIKKEDVRVWLRARRVAANVLFLVDASGSMGAKERMKTVKGAILALLREAYQKRDRVGLIAFRRTSAETLLPMTRSVELAERALRSLPTGGKTPLVEGLGAALKMIEEIRRKEEAETVLVLVTDGRMNAAAFGQAKEKALQLAQEISYTNAHCIVLDTEKSFPKVGVAPEIARYMKAGYATIEQLSAKGVLEIVERFRYVQNDGV